MLAQVIADVLGVELDDITVNVEHDTQKDPWSIAHQPRESRCTRWRATCRDTHARVLDVDVKDSVEPLHPAHGGRRRRKGLAGGWMSTVGDDGVAMLEVRGERAVVSGEMGARS